MLNDLIPQITEYFNAHFDHLTGLIGFICILFCFFTAGRMCKSTDKMAVKHRKTHDQYEAAMQTIRNIKAMDKASNTQH